MIARVFEQLRGALADLRNCTLLPRDILDGIKNLEVVEREPEPFVVASEGPQDLFGQREVV